MTSFHEPRLAAALLALLGGACSDSSTAPSPGEIRVSVATVGADLDLDGYEFVVDSGGPGQRRSVFANGTGQLANISAGTHTVKLERIAENCTVSSPHPLTVTVMPGQLAEVRFEVVCVGTGISITARTTGTDAPNNYDVIVDGQFTFQVGSNGTVVVSRLQPGTHSVALRIFGDNCTVAGSTPRAIEVVSRSVAEVLFEVACVEPLRPERIAFVADSASGRGTEQWIALVNPDGTDATKLVRGHSPKWSPDGKRLVFSTTYCDEWYYYYYDDPCVGGVFLIDPETRNVTEVPAANRGLTPTWVPPGDRIAFRRCCELGFQSTRLVLFALDAGTVQLLAPVVKGITDPAWSPDGERIASSCMIEGSWDVCLMDKSGGNVVRLTNDSEYDFSPAWSPDGTRIAFARFDGTSQQKIVTLTVATGVLRTVTDGSRPSWSREATMLVFTGAGGLYTSNADGSNRTRLTSGVHYDPAWRP